MSIKPVTAEAVIVLRPVDKDGKDRQACACGCGCSCSCGCGCSR